MENRIHITVLKIFGGDYRIAINGKILDAAPEDRGTADLYVPRSTLASMFTIHELEDMLEIKREEQKEIERVEKYHRSLFVTNKEFADWLKEKDGKRLLHVVPKDSSICDVIRYEMPGTEWAYPHGLEDEKAARSFDIYVQDTTVENPGWSILTRETIGLA